MMKVNKILLVGLMVVTSLSIFGLATAMSSGSSAGKDSVVLSKSNLIVLSGEVDGTNTAEVIARVRFLSGKKFSSGQPLYLFMNTPGGSIQSGLELIESLNGLSRPISTVTLFAASMGFQIVENLGPRLILRNGILMSHRAAGEFSGYFGGQRPSQLDNRYNFWLSRIAELDQQVVDRSGGKQTLESYQKAYANEMWLTGSQSVSGGYADRIVTVSCDSSLDGVTSHSLDFLGVQILYDTDNCPLNTSPMHIRIANPDTESVPFAKDRIEDIKAKFMEQYVNKQRAVVPMYW
jgi:ATP-dependent Clp protease, protease subunit